MSAGPSASQINLLNEENEAAPAENAEKIESVAEDEDTQTPE